MNKNTVSTREALVVIVTVKRTEGSAPREEGAWMTVGHDTIQGTIGGGHLELQAIEEARRRLVTSGGDTVLRYALGPSLGQCCGGVVYLEYRRAGADDVEAAKKTRLQGYSAVALFGGGHVGKALVHLLGTLPFNVTWIDSRDEIFPADVPANVACEHSDPVQAAVTDLVPGSRVLIMSFSHAEDLDVVAACLQRQREHRDLPFVGLIGSRTKWAVFRHRLVERGFTPAELAHVTCPIGVPGIPGKEPEVIAVAVAAQLLLPLAG